MSNIKIPKKLIEVALPLNEINEASGKEKSVRQGHPSSLHLWWARRPLATARAVWFAQLVNDPGYNREIGFGVNKREAEIKREKLFQIIRDLVKWENTNNNEVLQRAREAIWESWRETCYLNRKHPQSDTLFNPAFLPEAHDPFAGGGAIPLEAQRLGLTSYASDLNPVPILINKAMLEIPPRFSGRQAVGRIPDSDNQHRFHFETRGAGGLSADIYRYGLILKQLVEKEVGWSFPDYLVTGEIAAGRPDLKKYIGRKLKPISWIWARTVKSPSPAFSSKDVPLVTNFVLSTKKGKEVWIEPDISGETLEFKIRLGEYNQNVKKGTKSGHGANFTCLYSGGAITPKQIKKQAQDCGLGSTLLAVVAEGERERVYLPASKELEAGALGVSPEWLPNLDFAKNSRHMTPWAYGLDNFSKLYSNRQLLVIDAFCKSIPKIAEMVFKDALEEGWVEGEILTNGGRDAKAYSEAVVIMLTLAIGKLADLNNTLCGWEPIAQCPRHVFGRQALPMVWDYAEANPFGTSSGSWTVFLEGISKAHAKAFSDVREGSEGVVEQADATLQTISENKVISTDPPYYDNVPYADLADFFYVWHRRALREILPDLYKTIAVPKEQELVADSMRQGSNVAAEQFFMDGMQRAMTRLSELSHPSFPVTIYYAFKQSEKLETGVASTGWETFLEGVINSGFEITGTWPVRTENASRMRGQKANALASSILLVCQKNFVKNKSVSRRQFQRELREEMPEALEAMIGGREGLSPIAPVDLAQAAIGPGMAIFSKYESVLNQDGTKMSVHDALILINRAITDYLNPDSGNFDNDTLFCDDWFSQYGWSQGQFGEADTLARAKGTSVDGVRDAGVIESGGGKVRLLKWTEYLSDWDPKTDTRTPVWEACHQMIRVLNQHGEAEAGALLARMPERGEHIRQLAYHLYTLCERKKWAEEARAYNELIGSWTAIVSASLEVGEQHYGQTQELDF